MFKLRCDIVRNYAGEKQNTWNFNILDGIFISIKMVCAKLWANTFMNAAKTTARFKFEKYGNRENRKPTKCCSDLNRG